MIVMKNMSYENTYIISNIAHGILSIGLRNGLAPFWCKTIPQTNDDKYLHVLCTQCLQEG